MREIVIGGAQMSPIQKAEPREAVVGRMLALIEEAHSVGCDLVVYPELCLTTFFPRSYFDKQVEVDVWFEKNMPDDATMPLFIKSKELGIAISFGYAELTPDGAHFNTSILTDKLGNIIG